MQDILESDEFTTWFRILENLVYEHDLTDSSVDPEDFVEAYLEGDSQVMVISVYYGFDITDS
jgi:methylmalonyl-CoA mutase cobalamin-binding subunit